jgi:hypothetical protein
MNIKAGVVSHRLIYEDLIKPGAKIVRKKSAVVSDLRILLV